MNGIPLSVISILIHNGDNWSRLLMIQSTNISNGNWSSIIIINDSNVYMPVWGCIDDSNLLTSGPSISTPSNQLLIMCDIVGGNVDKWGVNLTIYCSINIDIFHTLCRRHIGEWDYLPYIRSRNLLYIGKVGEYHRSLNIIITLSVWWSSPILSSLDSLLGLSPK